MFFKITKKSKKSRARLGIIETAHGRVRTPAFYPVATKATVKTLTPADIKRIGFEAVLANTYHLYLQPGHKLVKKMGGLHRFMNWSGPIATDSGGFQVFSLGFGLEHGVGKIGFFPGEDEQPRSHKTKLMTVDETGVNFRSHLDGSKHRLTPKKSIEIQEALGADIIFAFDECTSPLADYEYTKKAVERTSRWAEICLKARKRKDQHLFGIVQGGEWRDLREQSAKFIGQMPFDGLAIGGSLGKSKKDMFRIIRWVVSCLPENKPRHLLGIGYPEDIRKAVRQGIDLFDCVYPTRVARHGILLTNRREINIARACYRQDKRPVAAGCDCDTCRNFSRAYLHHLFRAKEILASRLATIHNLHFMFQLVKRVRTEVKTGRL